MLGNLTIQTQETSRYNVSLTIFRRMLIRINDFSVNYASAVVRSIAQNGTGRQMTCSVVCFALMTDMSLLMTGNVDPDYTVLPRVSNNNFVASYSV